MARMVHKDIAILSYEIAKLCYEQCASKSNAFYKANPNMIRWAKANQLRFIGLAREALTKLLTMDSTTPEQKDKIMETLIAERTLPKGKVNIGGASL